MGVFALRSSHPAVRSSSLFKTGTRILLAGYYTLFELVSVVFVLLRDELDVANQCRAKVQMTLNEMLTSSIGWGG